MATSPTQQDTIVYQLAAQMMAAAATDGDRARIDRALDLVETVERTNIPGQFIVQSGTTPDATYHVEHVRVWQASTGQMSDVYICTCRDYQQRGGPCKHGRAAELFCAAERADADAHTPEPLRHRCPTCGRSWPTADAMMACFDSHGGLDDQCPHNLPDRDVCDEGVLCTRCGEVLDGPDQSIRLELTGRAYLALVRQDRPLAAIGGCTKMPLPSHLRQLAEELYGPDPSAA